MKLIGDFLSERLARELPAPKAGNTSDPKGAALMDLRNAAPPAKVPQLADALQQFAASAEFAATVNDAVPPPRPGESEDEFVKRAKAALVALLLARFGR
jgi:hypothetical protein